MYIHVLTFRRWRIWKLFFYTKYHLLVLTSMSEVRQVLALLVLLAHFTRQSVTQC